MTQTDRILGILTECQVPLAAREIAKAMGRNSSSEIAPALARLLRWGKVRKVSKGIYEPADRRTVGEIARVEVRRDAQPAPSCQDRPSVELKPEQGHRTVNLLLEVIARADDPKPYAGVIREISDLLATA